MASPFLEAWKLLKALPEQQHHENKFRDRKKTIHPAIYGMLSRLQNVPEGGTPNLKLSNLGTGTPPIPNTIDGEGSNFGEYYENLHDEYYQDMHPVMRRDGKYTPQDMINYFYQANPEAAAKYFGTEDQIYEPAPDKRVMRVLTRT